MSSSGGIDAYIQLIYGNLAASPVVKSQDIQTDKRTPTEGYLRGDVLFKDDSRLHFRELVTTDPVVQRISYTYHYQSADTTIIFATMTATIFRTYLLRRITSILGMLTLLRQILPIWNLC